MKREIALGAAGLGLFTFGLGIQNVYLYAFGLFMINSAITFAVVTTAQAKLLVLASESRDAFSEQNGKLAGMRDMLKGFDGDLQRMQEEIDHMDLDQLKKFEARLQFLEGASNVKHVLMGGRNH